MDTFELISKMRIVPVVALKEEKDAVALADALISGGLPIAEITFRTDAAETSIRTISKNRGEMLVGAGTVTSVAQAQRAIEAGAKFIVTPGFSEKVTEFALDNSIPIFPGVCTPSELMKAMEYGLNVVKFFPAAQYGGLKTIKALSGPFPSMKFMPTGGITAENLREYLDNPQIIACGGSWMVKGDWIAEGRFDRISAVTAEAVKIAGER